MFKSPQNPLKQFVWIFSHPFISKNSKNTSKIWRPLFNYQQQFFILIFNHPFLYKSGKYE